MEDGLTSQYLIVLDASLKEEMGEEHFLPEVTLKPVDADEHCRVVEELAASRAALKVAEDALELEKDKRKKLSVIHQTIKMPLIQVAGKFSLATIWVKEAANLFGGKTPAEYEASKNAEVEALKAAVEGLKVEVNGLNAEVEGLKAQVGDR